MFVSYRVTTLAASGKTRAGGCFVSGHGFTRGKRKIRVVGRLVTRARLQPGCTSNQIRSGLQARALALFQPDEGYGLHSPRQAEKLAMVVVLCQDTASQLAESHFFALQEVSGHGLIRAAKSFVNSRGL
jgi:hypothetical protein